MLGMELVKDFAWFMNDAFFVHDLYISGFVLRITVNHYLTSLFTNFQLSWVKTGN